MSQAAILSFATRCNSRPTYSFVRYWDAVVKQQQVQRKAEEDIHRQRWTAYFEDQANAGTADMKGDMGQDELDDARHTDNGTDTVLSLIHI